MSQRFQGAVTRSRAAKTSKMSLEDLAAMVEQQAVLLKQLQEDLKEKQKALDEIRKGEGKSQPVDAKPTVIKVETTDVTTPMPYDGTSDFSAYLRKFTVVADQNGWDDKKRRAQLTSNLEGEAVMEVDMSDETTYSQLQAVLKKAFSPSDADSSVSELRSRKQGKGESLDTLV